MDAIIALLRRAWDLSFLRGPLRTAPFVHNVVACYKDESDRASWRFDARIIQVTALAIASYAFLRGEWAPISNGLYMRSAHEGPA